MSAQLHAGRRAALLAAALAAALAMAAAGCGTGGEGPSTAAGEKWLDLFDGKTLAGWKVSDFEDHGPVAVRDGRIVLGAGTEPITGITWTGDPLPDMDYEVTFEAMRLAGSDFFGTITFPVFDSYCSLVLGGWGGEVVGISSFDGNDAVNNETCTTYPFQEKRWHHVRLRVTPKYIDAWIDGKQVVEAEPGDRKISVREEVEGSKPFGLSAWRTEAALRAIRIRRLAPGEGAAQQTSAEQQRTSADVADDRR